MESFGQRLKKLRLKAGLNQNQVAKNAIQNVGTFELSYAPYMKSNASKDTDFGNMKIKCFSNSALKNIKITFTKDDVDKAINVTCITDKGENL